MAVAKRVLQKYKIWLICLLTVAVMAVLKPNFLSYDNIYGLCASMMSYGVVALGLTVSLIAGEINISIGSVLAFSGMVFGATIEGIGLLPAFLLAVAAAWVIGLLDGYFVAYKRLPAFLVAVVFMISVRGLALLISGSQNIVIDNPLFRQIGSAKVGPVPVLFLVMVLCAVLIELFLRYTQPGRNLFAVGGSAEVAEACGLNEKFYKMMAISFSSLMAGVGGVILTTRLSSAIPSVGEDAVITILPIVVIGGTSINGGKGGTIWTLSGAFLMYLLFNIMSMFNIYVSVQSLVKGLVLLCIVVADKYMVNKNKKV